MIVEMVLNTRLVFTMKKPVEILKKSCLAQSFSKNIQDKNCLFLQPVSLVEISADFKNFYMC